MSETKKRAGQANASEGLAGCLWLACIIVGICIVCVYLDSGDTDNAVVPKSTSSHVSFELAESEYCLDNIRVIDGDTVEADILFPLGVSLRGEQIRFSDYDAYEKSKRMRAVDVTDDEVAKGKEAALILAEFIEGKRVVLLLGEGDRDNYGRVLGRAAVYSNDGQRIWLAEFMGEKKMLR